MQVGFWSCLLLFLLLLLMCPGKCWGIFTTFFKGNIWVHCNLVSLASFSHFNQSGLWLFWVQCFLCLVAADSTNSSQSCMKVKIFVDISGNTPWCNKYLCLKSCSVNLLQKNRSRSCGIGIWCRYLLKKKNNRLIKVGYLAYHAGRISCLFFIILFYLMESTSAHRVCKEDR